MYYIFFFKEMREREREEEN